MLSNPAFMLAVIALILAIVSYYPGAPTLGVAVILVSIALMLLVAKPTLH
jgi:hypothetical protein